MDGANGYAPPLAGVRVVDLTTYLAGPAAGRMLAYLGAEVIKVEPPAGDPFRFQGDIYGIPVEDDNNPLFAAANDGKRFVTVDLKTEEGRRAFYALVKTADILITNMRMGPLQRLHVTYDELHDINPRLVYGRISGYGTKGPLASRLGFDSTAYFARGGHMLDYVEPGSPPNNMMLGSGDVNTALALVGGVLAALAGATLTGEGRMVDVSLLHTSVWMASMDYVVSQYGEDFFIDRVYRCKDGVYMYLQAITDKQKAILLDMIGMTRAEYDDHFGAIPKLREIYAQKTFAEWASMLEGTGVCIERLRHIEEVPRDRQARDNGFLRPYGRGTDVWMPMPPVTFDGCGEGAFSADVRLGRDNESILSELGC